MPESSRATREFETLVERRIGRRRSSDQEPVAFLEHALDILRSDMRVADHDIALLAGGDDFGHRLADDRVIVD